ncbi:MAG TPA: IPT/TIG domain-containing protein, partial [Terriglobales bacterium]|nr:IPT/TIG domain-containing protein [Terriglobales bacterium]
FNGTAATFKVLSSSEISATVPAGATTGTITVTTPSGTLATRLAFLVTPQITSFIPPSGTVGTTVTITGVSLTETSKVTFGGVSASFTVDSDTQVTATVPTGAKMGKIMITTPGGTASSASNFTVTT